MSLDESDRSAELLADITAAIKDIDTDDIGRQDLEQVLHIRTQLGRSRAASPVRDTHSGYAALMARPGSPWIPYRVRNYLADDDELPLCPELDADLEPLASSYAGAFSPLCTSMRQTVMPQSADICFMAIATDGSDPSSIAATLPAAGTEHASQPAAVTPDASQRTDSQHDPAALLSPIDSSIRAAFGKDADSALMQRLSALVREQARDYASTLLRLRSREVLAQAVPASSLARRPDRLDSKTSAESWVRSVQTFIRAQSMDIDSERALALIETYLSSSIARCWEQRKAVISATRPVTFADLRNCVLTTQDGIHPADAARNSFVAVSYDSSKSMLDNLTHYRHLYDTMLTSCDSTRVMPLSAFDLYNHLMRFLAHGVRSVYSVILASAQRAIASQEDTDRFVSQASATGAFYTSLFDSLLSEAQSLARMVPSAEQHASVAQGAQKRARPGSVSLQDEKPSKHFFAGSNSACCPRQAP